MIFRYQSSDHLYEIELERYGNRCRAVVGDETFEFEILEDQPGVISLRQVASISRPVRIYWAVDQSAKWLCMDGCTYKLDKPVPAQARRNAGQNRESQVRAPMPALVRQIELSAGELVAEGQNILILEAMKMEIRISAPVSGRISRLLVTGGQTVARDDLLAEISPVESTQQAETGKE